MMKKMNEWNAWGKVKQIRNIKEMLWQLLWLIITRQSELAQLQIRRLVLRVVPTSPTLSPSKRHFVLWPPLLTDVMVPCHAAE